MRKMLMLWLQRLSKFVLVLLISYILFTPALAENTTKITIIPEKTEVNVGDTFNVTILTNASISGYNLKIKSDLPIINIQFPEWAKLTKNSTIPSCNVEVRAVDLFDMLNETAISLNELLKLTLKATKTGICNLAVTGRIDNDDGSGISVFSSLEIEVKPKANIIIVPDNYSTIQQAVNAASSGDTILVFNKKCNEVVKINKPLTLKSSGSEVKGFEIYAENVTIDNFTIKGYGLWSNKVGILIKANNVKLINNTITDFDVGICIENSNNNTITRNNIKSNNIGIKLSNSFGNLIYLNNFDNTNDVKIENSESRFYSPHLMLYEYKYNNKRYVNYLGNYWSDINKCDKNGNGISSWRYYLERSGLLRNYDDAPLMKSFNNYKLLKNPISPLKFKGKISIDDPKTLLVSGNHVFVIANNDLIIFNKKGEIIGIKRNVGEVSDLTLKNNVLLLINGYNIYMVDVSNLKKPKYFGEHYLSGWSGEIDAVGDFAFYSYYSESNRKEILKVLDISNLNDVKESIVKNVPSKYAYQIRIVMLGSFGLLSVDGGDIAILDFSNFCNPIVVDKMNFNVFAPNIYCDGNHLIHYGDGFVISKLNICTNWIDVETNDIKILDFRANKLEIIGNYMLLLSKGDVVIYDISDLSNPKLVGVEYFNARDIFVYDDEIYIATPTGIKVYAIYGQSKPVAEFNYKKSENKVSFEAVGDYIKYEWDLDGEKKEGKRIEHTFSKGIHFVTLKVTDGNGFTNVKTKIIKISNTNFP
ncbi:MAG: hypothetical protein J7K36_06210 [Archaeoglobaceae archaeon]|nr:hypothetical protein [Archaeoglobaceae archaeon]